MNAWQYYGRKLPEWLQWGLGLILAWQLGSWVAQALQPVSLPQLPPLQFAQPDFKRHPLSTALFGQSRAQSLAPAAPPTRKMRPDQLGIEVEGLISLDNGQGVALIKQKNGKTKIVRVGEEITQGMRLEAVAPQSITVSVRGERILVPLRKNEATGGVFKAENSTAQAPVSPTAPSPHKLRQVAQQLKRQPFRVLEYAQLQPVSQGVKIKARPGKAQWLQAIGLQDGDVVTSVDGMAVKTLMHQSPAWQRLIHKQHWQLEVIRNGVRQYIEVNMP